MCRHRLAHADTHALHLFFLLLDFDECSISELFTVIFTCLIFSKVEVVEVLTPCDLYRFVTVLLLLV